MKTKLFLLAMLSSFLTFGQNQSVGNVNSSITIPISSQFGTEIFRFRAGLVTQLDFGSQFDFTNSRWFAMGRVPAGTQTFYGLRFQLPNKSIIMGYNDLSAINPRIEWIGNPTASTLGNLEFRVGSGFGTPGSPGPNLLVATMTSGGNTIFGPNVSNNNPFLISANQPRVGIFSSNNQGLSVISTLTSAISIVASGGSTGLQASGTNSGVSGSGATGVFGSGLTGLGAKGENFGLDALSTNGVGANIVSLAGRGFSVESIGNDQNLGGSVNTNGGAENTGIFLKTVQGKINIGIQSIATDATVAAIGLQGITDGNTQFEAGVYGQTPFNGNQYAGYFDGAVFSTVGYNPSDAKLKNNIVNEESVLERIEKLRPVTYEYKRMAEMNLPLGTQHGFVSQELAEVFPELTLDVTKPVFNKEGKIISNLEFKAVNYNGLISVLTSAVNELHTELKTLKNEIAEYKANVALKDKLNSDPKASTLGFVMEQNIPNPFLDQTQIRYELAQGAKSASILIFDLNGRLIKEYSINDNKGILVVNASDIGKGLFLYTLVQNGAEIMTKKMLVK